MKAQTEASGLYQKNHNFKENVCVCNITKISGILTRRSYSRSPPGPKCFRIPLAEDCSRQIAAKRIIGKINPILLKNQPMEDVNVISQTKWQVTRKT